jgi:hypothetical protein
VNIQLSKRLGRSVAAGLAALALSACGGGGDSGPATGGTNTPVPQAQVPTTDTQPLSFTASAQTLASKSTTSNLSFDNSGFSILGGCTKPVTNSTVYLQTHTAVFAAEGVSENDQIEAAEHTENAIIEIRQRLPNPRSATVGLWDNKRVHVCVQNESPDNGFQAGVALAGTGPNYAGRFVAVSGSRFFFLTGTARSAISQGGNYPGKSYQAIYQRLFTHELVHVAQFGQSSAVISGGTLGSVDRWFTEGIARYFEFGKSVISRERIGTDLLTINPIKASDARVAFPGNQYNAAAAVFAYLLSPLGANNTEATVATFYNSLRTETEAQSARCSATLNTAAGCWTTSAGYEAWRSAMFERVFEGTFKEKDGSPMKLRAGTNNLQDTLPQRIGEFW